MTCSKAHESSTGPIAAENTENPENSVDYVTYNENDTSLPLDSSTSAVSTMSMEAFLGGSASSRPHMRGFTLATEPGYNLVRLDPPLFSDNYFVTYGQVVITETKEPFAVVPVTTSKTPESFTVFDAVGWNIFDVIVFVPGTQ